MQDDGPAYMAKVYLFQGKWQECATATDEVINSGKYQLLPDFRNIFLPENDNCPEILFSVQASINDGSPNNYNGNPATVCYLREALIPTMVSFVLPKT
mgnify:FL=1